MCLLCDPVLPSSYITTTPIMVDGAYSRWTNHNFSPRICKYMCVFKVRDRDRDKEFQWSINHPSSSPSLKPNCISPLDLWNNHHHHHHFWFAWFYCYSDCALYFATRAVLSHAVSQSPKGPITPHRNTVVGLGDRACWAGGSSPPHLPIPNTWFQTLKCQRFTAYLRQERETKNKEIWILAQWQHLNI